METLVEKVEELKNSDVRIAVDKRIEEFRELGKKSSDEIFRELCFCITTANFNAQRSIEMQNSIGNGYYTLTEQALAAKLKSMGHRFPEARAKYIVGARKHRDMMEDKLQNAESERELRKWIAENVKGLGYKEASHFLRNIGFMNLAIIDFHILDLLARHNLIERPKTLTPKKYLEIEDVLRRVAERTNLTLAELDLYLWYIETGKVLK